ncbi:MAG: PAS domain S-box protein [Oscillochloris sp.]|nr:PAS domain S-box protein [Oscillochloris sp.]
MQRLLDSFMTDAIPQADAARRARNVRFIALAQSLIAGLLVLYALVIDNNPLTITLTFGGVLAFVLIYFTTDAQKPDRNAWLLVGITYFVITLEMLNRGRFGLTPFMYVLVSAFGGVMLRPRHSLTVGVITIGTVVTMWLLLPEATFLDVGPGALLLLTLATNLTIALIAVLNAVTILRALQVAEEGADQTHRIEVALRESERYYRLIAGNARDLIALLDRHGAFLYASPSYAQALGYAPVTIIGIDASDLVHPDEREGARGDFFGVVAGDEIQRTFRVITSNGTIRWLNTRITSIYDEDEQFIVVVARDITEQRLLEFQLQHVQKMESLGMLAGSIAHDFNNLVTIISTSAEFAAESLDTQHSAYADLIEIRAAAQRAAELNRQLLTFARRQPSSPQQVELGEVVRSISGLIERIVGKQIVVILEIEFDTPLVLVDPGQVEQVLLNMAANARDAMPDGGTLTIALSNLEIDMPLVSDSQSLAPGTYVCLMVQDSGMGMSEEVQQRIFEPFFTTKGPERGTGLGLATCYGIVTQNGGRITVQSALGVGSTFRILLPALMQTSVASAY